MIQTIEELTANAWPGLQNVIYDGWIARFANGYTRRANSVLPLYLGRTALDEKMAFFEEMYRQRGLPTVVKLAGRVESSGLNDFLLARGYRAEADTSVQAVDIHDLDAVTAPDVRLSETQSAEWEAAFQSMSGLRDEQQANHRKIIAAIAPRKCFVSLHVDGQISGAALGVLQNGWIGAYDVIIHPDQRGRGCGERLMRSLLAWGRSQGAERAYLQVMLNNAPALRLYHRLGYREQYQYWYCVKAF